MTEDELTAEIAIVSIAITNILKTGQEYAIGSGPSSRTFKAAEIDSLRNYRTELQLQLQTVQGKGGLALGF